MKSHGSKRRHRQRVRELRALGVDRLDQDWCARRIMCPAFFVEPGLPFEPSHHAATETGGPQMTRTTSDGLTLTQRQADEIRELFPRVDITTCTHELRGDVLVVYDRDGDGKVVLQERVRT